MFINRGLMLSPRPEDAAAQIANKKVITYLGQVNWTSGSDIAATINIGPMHPNKEIFTVHALCGSSTVAWSSATVGGLSATKATNHYASAGPGVGVSFVDVSGLAGGNKVCQSFFTGTITDGGAGIYAVYNRILKGNNQKDTTGQTSTTLANPTLSSTTMVTDDIWFGALAKNNTSYPTNPGGGIIVDFEFANVGMFAWYHRDFQTSGSTPSDSWTFGSNLGAIGSWAFG